MNDHVSRKDALKSIVVLPALAGALLAATRAAEAKSSKATVKYQGKPKNGQECDDCRLYIAGKSAKVNGACQIVDGAISPHGWCVAFAKK